MSSGTIPGNTAPQAWEVRARRRHLHLTQEQLAALAGVTARTVGDIERGVVQPHRGTLRLLGLALDSADREGP